MAVSEEFLGFALNVSQRLAIRTSLSKLRINEKNANIAFWGKITGSARDYFIAQGTTATDRIIKTFYFTADDGVTFAKLPGVDEFIEGKVGAVRGLFTGNPANLYKDPNAPAVDEEEEEPEPEEDEDAEEKAPDPSKRKLTELERLAHTVKCIDQDTCVVPRGAFHMTPVGLIKQNKAFEGFSAADAQKLPNFLLFRDPQSETTLKRIRTLGVTSHPDFLDAVTQDQPAGVWVTQMDEGVTKTRLRSLLWPGYEFKMEVGTSNYVGAYFGHGLRNDDVMFML